MRVFSMLLALPLFLVGCGDKSAVSLSAHITNGAVTVRNDTFGSSASGGFKLRLALGPEASGSVTVTAQTFQLLTQGKAVLIDQLPIGPATAFPVIIGKGQNKDVDLTFGATMVDHDTACAGPLTFFGAVDDATGSGSYPVTSGPVTASCD